MTDWEAPLITLLEMQQRLERGPKREGAFALWLTTRVALDTAAGSTDGEKALRRRVVLLRQRLQALVIPRPLERGLRTALAHLEEGTATASRIALTQLVAPSREALGQYAADAVASAAKLVHERDVAKPGG
ncbi:MAG: hypothetical protein ABIR59_05200 [Gemmatimonadales bacterium]